MVVVFLICVQFDLDLSFSSCLRRLELGPLAGFISVAPFNLSVTAGRGCSFSVYLRSSSDKRRSDGRRSCFSVLRASCYLGYEPWCRLPNSILLQKIFLYLLNAFGP
jgi:hypothetical protein